MPFPNFIGGHHRLWTRENVLAGLVRAAGVIKGPLPCCDFDYKQLKKGRLDWPTSHRVLEYFGSMARAWIAAGVEISRVSLSNINWTPEEETYLETYAGITFLENIGKHLRRSGPACKRRLYSMGTTARENQGLLSAAELAQEFDCSCHRIRRLLIAGTIKGKYDRPRNRWQVNMEDITPQIESLLRAPKQTHKTWPTDKGDYYQRYGIRRHLINGKMILVEIKRRICPNTRRMCEKANCAGCYFEGNPGLIRNFARR